MSSRNKSASRSCEELGKEGLIEEKREHKLYVGNLDHRVTEYYVIKIFSPFGKIHSEEYMWHTHGPKRGEPRGFAFVEFSKREEAEKAKECMNGRLAFGRPLVVRFVDEKAASVLAERASCKTEPLNPPPVTDLLSGASFPTLRRAKITAIKNKLRAMEEEDILRNNAGTKKRAKT